MPPDAVVSESLDVDGWDADAAAEAVPESEAPRWLQAHRASMAIAAATALTGVFMRCPCVVVRRPKRNRLVGLARQLLAVLRELVSAPAAGECVEATVVSDRRAVDNELSGARLGSKDGGECATGGGTRRITHGQ